jgi:hypothetical protein
MKGGYMNESEPTNFEGQKSLLLKLKVISFILILGSVACTKTETRWAIMACNAEPCETYGASITRLTPNGGFLTEEDCALNLGKCWSRGDCGVATGVRWLCSQTKMEIK